MSVFTDAIRVLEERGWHQGGYEGNDGSVCLEGAVAVAKGEDPDCHTDAHCTLAGAAHALLARTSVAFNDDPHTTAEDVILFLKRAHELAEAE